MLQEYRLKKELLDTLEFKSAGYFHPLSTEFALAEKRRPMYSDLQAEVSALQEAIKKEFYGEEK